MLNSKNGTNSKLEAFVQHIKQVPEYSSFNLSVTFTSFKLTVTLQGILYTVSIDTYKSTLPFNYNNKKTSFPRN